MYNFCRNPHRVGLGMNTSISQCDVLDLLFSRCTEYFSLLSDVDWLISNFLCLFLWIYLKRSFIVTDIFNIWIRYMYAKKNSYSHDFITCSYIMEMSIIWCAYDP